MVCMLVDVSYPGDSNYSSSVSATVGLTAQPATPAVTVTLSSSNILTTQPLTVTVAVSGGSGNLIPTGSVTLASGSYTSAPATLSNGDATINIPAGSLAAGAESLTVSYTPDSNSSSTYNSSTGSSSVTVSLPVTPAITWATPAAIPYGTALSATQLNAGSTVAGTPSLYSPALSTVLTAGAQTLTATFTPTDTIDYTTATATVTLTVNKVALSVITWATPAAIPYGTALTTQQPRPNLNAGSSVAGTFAYSPAPGTVPAVGQQNLTATFTPTDTTDYTTATAAVTLTVNKAPTTLTLSANPTGSAYGQQVTLSATLNPYSAQSNSTNGETVSFSNDGASLGTGTLSNGVATLVVTTLPIGTVSLTAAYGGDTAFSASGSNTLPYTVSPAAPNISFSVPNHTYGDPPFSVSASSNSTGAIAYSAVSGPATVSGTTVTLTGAGAVVLQASQSASGSYAAATLNATFAVAAESQTITFAAPASPITYGAAPVSPSASASSGLWRDSSACCPDRRRSAAAHLQSPARERWSLPRIRRATRTTPLPPK